MTISLEMTTVTGLVFCILLVHGLLRDHQVQGQVRQRGLFEPWYEVSQSWESDYPFPETKQFDFVEQYDDFDLVPESSIHEIEQTQALQGYPNPYRQVPELFEENSMHEEPYAFTSFKSDSTEILIPERESDSNLIPMHDNSEESDYEYAHDTFEQAPNEMPFFEVFEDESEPQYQIRNVDSPYIAPSRKKFDNVDNDVPLNEKDAFLPALGLYGYKRKSEPKNEPALSHPPRPDARPWLVSKEDVLSHRLHRQSVLKRDDATFNEAGESDMKPINVSKDSDVSQHVKLVGGSETDETISGNILIWHKNQWGGLCDEQFDKTEGQVVCRMLGYDKVVKVTHQSFFGHPKRMTHIWMKDIQCNGNEQYLIDCQFREWNASDCDDKELAGVICARESAELKELGTSEYVGMMPLSHVIEHLRLIGGQRKDQGGRVEVMINGSWGGVCGNGWGMVEGAVVCRHLGELFVSTSSQGDHFGCSDQNVLSAIKCNGSEETLRDCQGLIGDHCPAQCNHPLVTCTLNQSDVALNVDNFDPEIEKRHLVDDLKCDAMEGCLGPSAIELLENDLKRGDWNCSIGNNCRGDKYLRYLLRFNVKVTNVGNAPFLPKDSKKTWKWHSCDKQFHSMRLMSYQIVDNTGQVHAKGHMDFTCREDHHCQNHTQRPYFQCLNKQNGDVDQGIPPGCSRYFPKSHACQYVDLTDMAFRQSSGSGRNFTLRIVLNPDFKVAEQSYENNVVECRLDFDLRKTTAKMTSCKYAAIASQY